MSDDASFERTQRTRLERFHQRAVYDRKAIHAILDEALICHLGFTGSDGTPFVVPTAFVRSGERIYVHGSAASRTMRAAGGGIPVCVTVTLTDGIILARTAFNHSFNYRAVMIFGTAVPVADEEKEAALRLFTEGLVPGRWADIRTPTPQELKATSIMSVALDEVSAKVRTGPPADEGIDLEYPAWAGVIPLELTVLPPVPDPKMTPPLPTPDYVSDYTTRRDGSVASRDGRTPGS